MDKKKIVKDSVSKKYSGKGGPSVSPDLIKRLIEILKGAGIEVNIPSSFNKTGMDSATTSSSTPSMEPVTPANRRKRSLKSTIQKDVVPATGTPMMLTTPAPVTPPVMTPPATTTPRKIMKFPQSA